MRHVVNAVILLALMSSGGYAADNSMNMSTTPEVAVTGQSVTLQCIADEEFQLPIKWASIVITDAQATRVVNRGSMEISGQEARYDYVIPADSPPGNWKFKCIIRDQSSRTRQTQTFSVILPPAGEQPPPEVEYEEPAIAAHSSITEYTGPATCIRCHAGEAADMLESLHMKWSGPTPELVNTSGEELGKAVGGINTFCTYAMSSKGACFSCHVRSDGNAPHPPEVTDVDCLMCHSDRYQRKFVSDPDNTEDVVNILGERKTYIFGKVDEQGNYFTEPDFDKMEPGISMVNVARTVHLPTSASCLRCHAKAGGGDWTKRGDMGLSSADPTVDEDFHLARDGADMSCVNCHAAPGHKIAGRGIDLRQTEAESPRCQSCHIGPPHDSAELNRHAEGQVSCQVCHIREFAKGGPTEMSRDWTNPVWNQAFCSGQGGFVGEEHKQQFVKPEYVWFDRTSYVYNLGELIEPDDRGVYPMARAHGRPFDGFSSIVPIKRHFTVMPLHESGQIIPPVIMWMFMTGDFDLAVEKGMEEQGLSGNYTLVEADAEMLITHGVEPKEKAPSCVECHDNSGRTPDGAGILPLETLGYHNFASEVQSCTLCHEQKSLGWQAMHQEHRSEDISCGSCHSGEPTGFVKPQRQLCSTCHDNKSWREEGHKKHLEKNIDCLSCHTFS